MTAISLDVVMLVVGAVVLFVGGVTGSYGAYGLSCGFGA
jgi:hypothetical protein